MEKEKKSIWKKMAGFLGAAVMAAGLLVSTPVHAASTTYTDTHDGYSYTLYVSYNNTNKVATAYTKHLVSSSKTAKVTGCYLLGGVVKYIYGAESVSYTTENASSSVANLTGYDYCGSIGTHSIYYYTTTGIITIRLGRTQ